MKRLGIIVLTLCLTLSASPLMAQEEPSAGHEAGLPQFDPHWFPSQIFWLAVSFTLSYALFALWILPAIGGTLEKRQAKVEGDLSAAERLKNEAEAARQAYESGLDNARAEASKIIGTIHADLKAESERQTQNFRDKMEREMSALETRLAKAKANAMSEMNTIAAEIASEAARKIVGISFDPQKAQKVVADLNREAA